MKKFESAVIMDADFALICNDNSMMNARICSGDIAYIRQQDTVENGELAAVQIGDIVIIRRVWISEGCITLEPANPHYRSRCYWHSAMANVHILGKVVGCSFVM